MRTAFSKRFIKQAQKLDPAIRQRVLERIALFQKNLLHPTLRNRPLQGKFKAYRSIGITGDIRALYLQMPDEAIFDAVGTHSQLYG